MTHRMNPEIKDRWTSALRSGEYPQTKSALHRLAKNPDGLPVGHCCLGVLCELAVEDGVVKRVPSDDDPTIGAYKAPGDRAMDGVLPDAVVAWAGLRNTHGSLGSGAPLTIRNDNGATFAEIADLIEEHL